MFKKIFASAIFLFMCANLAQADVKKVAVVDIQKVVTKSAQVQALKKEQDTKKKELASFIKKAGEDIKKQTDPAKKKSLAASYDNQLKAKQDANAKAYKTKLETIDKNINTTIIQQAKAMGYDLVLTKGVVLYGGDDITEAILKVVK
jgi:Skp family chaperone for outer membrane proteins